MKQYSLNDSWFFGIKATSVGYHYFVTEINCCI